ncbi:2,5-didehydrogluconate reductase [Actinobacteria bacterium OK074]|nr:2,5-didehydrogluconate reductase [Actinobacteria bacterium OK074]
MSNHSPRHLTGLMEHTDIVPAVNQIELHPHFVQRELREFHAAHGIATQCWSPIGGISRYRPGDGTTDPLHKPVVTGLADRYGRTPAQVILRWHIEHGLCAIPKSVKTHRIAENFDVFDFGLTPDEVAAVDALDTGVRGGPDPDTIQLDSFS